MQKSIVLNKIPIYDYTCILMNQQVMRLQVNSIRLHHHDVYTEFTNKLALLWMDDKHKILDYAIHTCSTISVATHQEKTIEDTEGDEGVDIPAGEHRHQHVYGGVDEAGLLGAPQLDNACSKQDSEQRAIGAGVRHEALCQLVPVEIPLLTPYVGPSKPQEGAPSSHETPGGTLITFVCQTMTIVVHMQMELLEWRAGRLSHPSWLRLTHNHCSVTADLGVPPPTDILTHCYPDHNTSRPHPPSPKFSTPIGSP
ncbi:hypothetical protein PR048_018121 [Dryococelus australis]|uniref:Uncharacterized protein n=1 Tax=Dryococelus australis TaxID=614101 RepID=A0ABQ9HBK3_9NEOP|nr:hypothetical protein PR048_018121 [Dryococelus australis]